MTKPRDPDALLSAYLADGMTVLPDRVVDAVLSEVQRTRQRAARGRWRIRPMSRAALGAAAVVAVLVLGGAFYMSQRDLPVVTGPSATPEASALASPPAPTPTPTPTVEVSPSPAVQSLALTWTKVAMDEGSPQIAWLGDQFVVVDQDSGAVRTSTDGVTWHVLQPGDPDPGYVDLLKGTFVTWEDDVVAWGIHRRAGAACRMALPPDGPAVPFAKSPASPR